jgi:hypothetical protein
MNPNGYISKQVNILKKLSYIGWLDHRKKMQKIPPPRNNLYFKTFNPWQKKNSP